MCLFPVFLFCFLFLMIYKKAYRRERFLFLVPIFLAAGFLRIRQSAAPDAVEVLLTEEMECELYGTVAECSFGQNYGKIRVTKTELYLTDGECLTGGGDIIVYAPASVPAAPGSRIRVSGKIRPLSVGDNPGQFDEYEYYKSQGICAVMQGDSTEVLETCGKTLMRILWKGKQKLQQVFEAVLPEQEAGILSAMLLAEKGMLGAETKEMYRNSGISHILAVSGLHLSMIGLGAYKALKKKKAGAKLSMAVSAGVILLYACFTGFGISVTRAAIMLLLSVLSGWFGKTYDAPAALAAAALAVLIPQPLQLFQAGFLMSFGAVAGILLFAPLFQKMGMKLSGASLAVQLALLPVLLWFYYEIPLYSMVLNLLILPFLGLLILLSMLAGAAGCISLGTGRFLAGGAYVLLKGYELLCRLNEKLPGSRFCFGRPSYQQIVFYYLLLLIFYFLCKKFQQKRCLGFLLVFSVFLVPGSSKEIKVTYLSVGQGDCAVIQQDKMTILMDAGSSYQNGAEKILIPYLQYSGDTRIEYAVLSHADSDHYSMLKEILEEMAEGNPSVTIGTLIMPAAGSKEESYQMLLKLAGRAGVKCLAFSAGDGIRFNSMELFCLYPERSRKEELTDTNESSLVMLLETKTSAFLFTGDVSGKGEQIVLETLKEKKNGISGKRIYLKTAHHGSKYSSTEEFLQYLKNAEAVISCGKGNRYGHPHTETLERMEEAGISYRITWQTGAVRVMDGEEGEIFTWHDDWK